MQLKNSNFYKTQKNQKNQNPKKLFVKKLKTQIGTKVKQSNCDNFQSSNCDSSNSDSSDSIRSDSSNSDIF